jgi:hypothetical protein
LHLLRFELVVGGTFFNGVLSSYFFLLHLDWDWGASAFANWARTLDNFMNWDQALNNFTRIGTFMNSRVSG